MFIEPQFRNQRSGWIEVICGSMFSGKTEELIRRVKRVKYANQNVIIVKPAADTRYHEEDVISHDENVINAKAMESSKDILKLLDRIEKPDVIAIDEAQFFDEDLPEVCEQIVLKGIRIIIAGLDMDYLGKPFGSMPALLAKAEYITKLHAICPRCGNLATHSYRMTNEKGTVLIGEKDKYEPRCRVCYNMGNILDL